MTEICGEKDNKLTKNFGFREIAENQEINTVSKWEKRLQLNILRKGC